MYVYNSSEVSVQGIDCSGKNKVSAQHATDLKRVRQRASELTLGIQMSQTG